MKKISYFIGLTTSIVLLFSSCKKNEEYNYDANGGQKIVKFVAVGGYETNFANSNTIADAADPAQEIIVQLEFSAPNAHSQDITATVGVDAASILVYNATVSSPSKQYSLLPDSVYTIPLKTIVIKAGQSLSEPFKIIVDGSKVDAAKNLMLPVKIMSIAGAPSDVKVASGTGVAYFHFIGNPLAGSYSVVGTRKNYTGPVSAGILASTTNLGPLSPKTLAPITATDAAIDYANLGGSGWQYTITYDGTTISAAPNATMAAGIATGSYSTNSITYDAVNKVIHVISEYTNTAGNARLVEETWTKQ